jgi:hypothetical protein
MDAASISLAAYRFVTSTMVTPVPATLHDPAGAAGGCDAPKGGPIRVKIR